MPNYFRHNLVTPMWAWSDQEMEMRIEYRQILQSRFAAIYEAAGEIAFFNAFFELSIDGDLDRFAQ